MRRMDTVIGELRPEQVWRWSQYPLVGALGFGIAVILLSAWLSTTLLLVLSALLLGAIVFAVLARDELALLCAILVGFISVVRYADGFQIEEAVYGVLYLGYLSYWFVSRLFFYRDDILRTTLDWALFLFLCYVTLSLVLTPLLQGDVTSAISEWLSVTMLAFYFPIKEICIRQRGRVPQKPILLSVGAVALFVVLRNLNDYRIGLSQADYLWQIATGRVVMNEHILLMAAIVTLAFLIYARTWLPRVSLIGLFFLFSAGVLIGQSRAVWVSFALGVAIIYLLVDGKKRIQIVLLALSGLAMVMVVGSLVFDNFFTVIFAGLVDRLFSLRTAVTEDVSLINRFIEMEAAWQYIKQNPVVGHGFGVPIKYYSLVYEYTRENSFIHNGYVGVLYRHGLIGFSLLFFFYFGSLWTYFRTVRTRALRPFDRLILTAAVACLAAESLVGNTENPFATSDKTLIIGTIAGLAAASRHRSERLSPGPAEHQTEQDLLGPADGQ